jgi:hypothetical protein
MVTGESHYVGGVRNRLKVIERSARAYVEVDGDRLLMYVPDGTDAEMRSKIAGDWYRKQLRLAIPPLIGRWEPVIGREVPEATPNEPAAPS